VNLAQATVEIRTLIENTNFELFDFDYQVDDLSFKADIEQKILDFYFDYEIGFETPDMFKRKFKARFLRAVSYYNQLYNTTLLAYNPLINSKMSEALEQLSNTDSTNNNTTETDGNMDSTNSDYPQQSIGAGDFLAGANKTTDNTKATTKLLSNTNQTNNYSKVLEGITGISYQELIQKERELIIIIPNLIIEELKPCFILVQ